MLTSLVTLDTPGTCASLLERLHSLKPTSARRWGVMPIEGMLCHLDDAFTRMLQGDRSTVSSTWAGRNVIRPIALHTPLPWPRNVPTVPEVDQRRGGTPPTGFEHDRAKVLASLARFHAKPTWQGEPHPIMGPLTHWEWTRWAWLHTDHHLRQFST